MIRLGWVMCRSTQKGLRHGSEACRSMSIHQIVDDRCGSGARGSFLSFHYLPKKAAFDTKRVVFLLSIFTISKLNALYFNGNEIHYSKGREKMNETNVYKTIDKLSVGDVLVSEDYHYFEVTNEQDGLYSLKHLHQNSTKSASFDVRIETLQKEFKIVNWDQVDVYIVNREDLGEGFFTKMEIVTNEEDEEFYDLLEASNGEPYYEAHKKNEIHSNIASDLLSNGDRLQSELECKQYESANRLTYERVVKQVIKDRTEDVLVLSDLAVLTIRDSVLNDLYHQTFGFRAGLKTDSIIERLVGNELKRIALEKLA